MSSLYFGFVYSVSLKLESRDLISAGIHEYCTVDEILVFGRETGFPTQTLQRCYMYQSPQEMETKLINVHKSCYLVLILDSYCKRLPLSLLSYPDVNTI
jgi:hypothetical protein